ncbi:ABC transporter ATP-binding protein [Vibrio sp. SS-MA-C1-2]|uniref:ABC transporter ATP-binding protein n=1 Tax=Vibrio sp. SS-MA-C1-2 TaxID=2908646 RepID=UPI001F182C42|nr:ABC transporter ATP-binding protein [Vibrio sp. SS-MA-C1-2]UJF17409.1 ABC transporter ATP-binding protein [Vibrio sp. SS-MA-C1-2]
MGNYISVNHLTRSYGKQIALDNINFSINAGQVVGLLGHNGAGKSTLIRLLLGEQTSFIPTISNQNQQENKITIFGLDPVKDRAEIMLDLACISDVNSLPNWMKVKDLISYIAGVHPKFDPEKAKQLISKTDIQLKSKIGSLSKGMKVQLHLSTIMATESKILILDEPTLGLDLIYRQTFYQQVIEWFQQAPRAIIIASHEVAEIERLLTDVLILKQGKLIETGSVYEFKQRYIELESRAEHHEKILTLKPIWFEQGVSRCHYLFSRSRFSDLHKNELLQFGDIAEPNLSQLFVALQQSNTLNFNAQSSQQANSNQQATNGIQS